MAHKNNITKLSSGNYLIFSPESKRNRYKICERPDEEEKGIAMTGTTTILNVIDKPQLKNWFITTPLKYLKTILDKKEVIKNKHLEEAGKQCDFVKEEAQDIGTEAHDLIENYILWCIENCNGEPQKDEIHYPEMAKITNHLFLRFFSWAIVNVKQFIATEKSVCSEKYFVAGTIDFIYKDHKDRLVLGDFKTSNGIYKSYELQVSAYSKMYEEMGLGKIDYSVIVRCDKMTDIEIKEYNDKSFKFKKKDIEVKEVWNLYSNWRCFLGALIIYRSGICDITDNELDEMLETLVNLRW